MENKKTFAIIALVCSLVSVVILLFANPSSLSMLYVFLTVGLVLDIAAIVCGIIGKKSSKGMAITGMVIGIIFAILFCFAFIGALAYSKANNCVVADENNYKCEYLGQEVIVPKEFLREDQMKKEE